MSIKKLINTLNRYNSKRKGKKLSKIGLGKVAEIPYILEKKNVFFYLGFLSRTFTIHGAAGEGGGYPFNSSLPLPPASQTLKH